MWLRKWHPWGTCSTLVYLVCRDNASILGLMVSRLTHKLVDVIVSSWYMWFVLFISIPFSMHSNNKSLDHLSFWLLWVYGCFFKGFFFWYVDSLKKIFKILPATKHKLYVQHNLWYVAIKEKWHQHLAFYQQPTKSHVYKYHVVSNPVCITLF